MPSEDTTPIKLTPAKTGTQGHDVFDGSDNPQDVRPALTAIIQKIENEVSQLEDGQKLIIFYGEDHASHLDHFLEAAIATALDKKFSNRLMLGLEIASESRNTESLSTNFNRYTSGYYADILLEKGITACSGDVKSKVNPYGPMIDQSDPNIRNFITEHYPDYLDKLLDVGSPKGIEIRNSFMIHKVLEYAYAEDNNHDVIFFPVGQAHIIGKFTDDGVAAAMQDIMLEMDDIDESELEDTREDAPYSQSLCAFAAKNVREPRVLSIMTLGDTPQDNDYVLEKAQEHTGPILFLKGLDSRASESVITDNLEDKPEQLKQFIEERNRATMEEGHKVATELWNASGGQAGIGLPKPPPPT